MRKQLLITIVGTAIAALVLAGASTLILTRLTARRANERDVKAQAVSMAAGIASLRDRQELVFINVMRRSINADGLDIVEVTAAGIKGNVPNGISLPAKAAAEFRRGLVISGSNSAVAYAAVPILRSTGTSVLILSRRINLGLGKSVQWFLFSSLITLGVASILSVAISKRLSRPIAEAGRVAKAIASGDLSARVQDDGEHRSHELHDLAASVDQMADSLERSRVLEQQFLMSVSHDLRTPLTSIRGYADAIIDGAATDPVAAATVIATSADRLDRLVRDLLDLAKLDARRFTMKLGPIDVVAVARSATNALAPTAAQAKTNLVLQLAPTTVEAFATADRDRLAQSLANLIENAMKFASTTVIVAVWPKPFGVAITVDDDGPGIAPADLPHVFERLYVADRTPTRTENGSGLGLAIVKELAEAMGGSVTAEAGPLGGARITIRLAQPPAFDEGTVAV